MCGICGLAYNDNSKTVDSVALASMTDALIHRGPDEGDTWGKRNVGLGARRLSIIDVDHGHQPMTNEDESFVVAFNGEIYNAEELRGELMGKGFSFRTQCDTEVVLRATEAWGKDCVQRFNGMFAFAVFDASRQRLYVARDRLGIKPLFYTERDGGLAFSSELDSLRRSGLVTGEINPAALDAYFTYLYVPHPETIYEGVSELGPGDMLVWERGTIRREVYWRPEYKINEKWTLESAAEAYLELLEDSVRLRLMSDVPLGAFLSGGIDSTSIVAMLSRLSSNPVKTFTIGFDDPDADETRYARMAADAFGTDHTEAKMDPDLVSMASDLVRYFGQPFADSSAVPTWMVSKLAREHVTVALSGDGGDELFGGYSWLHRSLDVARYRNVPAPLRGAAGMALRLLPSSPMAEKLRRFQGDSFLSEMETFRRRQTCFSQEQRAGIYVNDFGQRVAGDTMDRFAAHWDKAEGLTAEDAMSHQDLRMYLPDDILTKVDRMSMAVSLEARVPLLDHRIVEFAATLPFHLKYNKGVSKRVVKHALGSQLPPELMRQRKRGFSIPIQAWFRGPLRDHFGDTVLAGDSHCAEYVQKNAVGKLFETHVSGRENLGHHLWALLNFEHWLRYMKSV